MRNNHAQITSSGTARNFIVFLSITCKHNMAWSISQAEICSLAMNLQIAPDFAHDSDNECSFKGVSGLCLSKWGNTLKIFRIAASMGPDACTDACVSHKLVTTRAWRSMLY